MDLILWRHAEAAAGANDLARKLTKRGEAQASRVASWLLPRLPENVLILASPAVRTRQTAAALGKPFDIEERLAPGRSPNELIAVSGWPDAQITTIIVGHQPTLGRAAARLLADVDEGWSVRKGAVWWYTTYDAEEGAAPALRCVVTPDMV
jgi:phosphohistidine phosphatase